VTRTAQIGLVSITGESSVGSGSRRIEAEVGIEALRSLIQQRDAVRRIAAGFKAPAAEVETKISEALEEVKRAQKLLAEANTKAAMALIPDLLASATEVSGSKLIAASVGELTSDSLRELILQVRERMGSDSVVILGASSSDRATVMVAAGSQAVASGKDSGALAKKAAEVLGGGGGGKKDLAQGGGPEISKLEQAIAEAKAML